MDLNPELLAPSTNFEALLELVVQSSHSQFFVVNDARRLHGAISLREVRRLIYERETLRHLVVASDLLDTQRPVLKESDNLDTAMHLFAGAGVDELAVVADDDPST
ncbi:MAG TPA: chloride channel protein EriC, partial [Nitrospinae bacterium]|nr:chloride channel protein EriC [Nitrospinota bacterium]